MERRPDPSTLEYVLKVKRMEVANCEAISQARAFEKEQEEWNARMDEVKRKEEKENW